MEDLYEKKTILLVDDSKTQLGFYRIHFSKAGYEVVTAENARDAFQKVFECCPDIIVCDVLMRDVSGFQFCKILKKNIVLKNIPVILFTAAVDTLANIFWAKKSKADYFISKNVDMIELLDLISKTIAKSTFSEAQKEQLRFNADKAARIFEENRLCSDIDWMKQVIAGEFRDLIRYTDDTPVFMTKLFNMLSHVLPYNLCFVAFSHLTREKTIEVHTNANNMRSSDEITHSLTHDFIREAFDIENPFANIIYETDIKTAEPSQNFSDYKQHVCIKVSHQDKIVAACAFYWTQPHNLTNISYYEDIAAMLTQLLQSKVYNENVHFLSYKSSNIGLYNKMQFLDNLNIELARTQIFNSSISLVVLSFADYDKLTGTYGAETVNLAIEKSIHLITATLRFPDKVYRYDHKTLLILLINADKEKGIIPINRILNILKNTQQSSNNGSFTLDAITTIDDNFSSNGNAEMFFEHVLNIHTEKMKNLESNLANESTN